MYRKFEHLRQSTQDGEELRRQTLAAVRKMTEQLVLLVRSPEVETPADLLDAKAQAGSQADLDSLSAETTELLISLDAFSHRWLHLWQFLF